MERLRGYVTTEREAQAEQMKAMEDACLNMDQVYSNRIP